MTPDVPSSDLVKQQIINQYNRQPVDTAPQSQVSLNPSLPPVWNTDFNKPLADPLANPIAAFSPTNLNIGSTQPPTSGPLTQPGEGLSKDQLIQQIMAGKLGTGADRMNAIKGYGFDPRAIQTEINQMMTSTQKKSTKPQKTEAKGAEAPVDQPQGSGSPSINWMQTLNDLLPYLAVGGLGYFAGRKF